MSVELDSIDTLGICHVDGACCSKYNVTEGTKEVCNDPDGVCDRYQKAVEKRLGLPNSD